MFCASKALFWVFAFGASAVRQNLLKRDTKLAASVMDAVGALIEAGATGKSADAFAKVMTGLSETPAAMESLREALRGVVAELEANVESKIVAGFHQTQTALNQKMSDLEAATVAAVESKGRADGADSTWISCVGVEKSKLEAVEAAEAALKTAQDNKVMPCQQLADRTPFSFEAKAIPQLSCDFSQNGNCDAEKGKFEAELEAEDSRLDAAFMAASASYTEAKNNCDAAKADVAEKTNLLESASQAFNTQKLMCLGEHEARQLGMCGFGSLLQQKCSKLATYNSLIADVDQVNGGEYSQPDRAAEWETTRTTKCMLNDIIAGTDINDVALDECKRASVFATEVGELDRKEAELAEQTTPENFTCDENTITFSGETWEIPQGAQPLSSNYNKVPYHPQVTTTPDSSAFSFCSPAGPGKA